MDSAIVILLVVLILFSGVAFILITEMLKKLTKDVKVINKNESPKDNTRKK